MGEVIIPSFLSRLNASGQALKEKHQSGFAKRQLRRDRKNHDEEIIYPSFVLIQKKQKIKTAKSLAKICFASLKKNNSTDKGGVKPVNSALGRQIFLLTVTLHKFLSAKAFEVGKEKNKRNKTIINKGVKYECVFEYGS